MHFLENNVSIKSLRLFAISSMCVVISLFGAVSASAQSGRSFYQGKTLTLLINFSAGGPADIEGRLLAQYLGRHIAGNPTVVVQNMGGAGGAIGANYLGKAAAPDGLTLSYFSGLATQAALESPSIRVDVSKFMYVGSVPGISVAYARSDLGGGLTAPESIMTKSNFWVGGLSPDANKDMRIRLELDLLGLKYKYLTGYPGTNEIRLALSRNELQLNVESLAAYRSSVEQLVQARQMIPLWYDVSREADAASIATTVAGIDAASYYDFYRKVKGQQPDNIEWRALTLLNELDSNFLRTLVLPPNSPTAAVDALSAALKDVQSDQDFQHAATTSIQFVPQFATGEKAARAFYESTRPNTEIREFLDKYVAQGQQ